MPGDRQSPLLASDMTCCGCSACLNACPVDAISMIENDEYFIVPHIDHEKCIACNACSKACPVVNFSARNLEHPECYAVRADDDTRMRSSSGGVFSLVARSILERGGLVCGAAFSDSFAVEHILIDSEKDLDLLRGSKYVQSNTGKIFRKIKELLVAEKLVFFTGTPCQIAGLKNFLGKDFAGLLTADILCHGVPSQHLFKQHVHSLNPQKDISRIAFRDKRFGWTSLKLLVEYTDGSEYTGDNVSDAYERVFHSNLALRTSCADCKFSAFPRHGDISMGDFWGYELFSPQHADAGGTSIVFINNEKGDKIFDIIKQSAQFIDNIAYTPDKIRNRIFAQYPAHRARQRFFDLLRKDGLEHAARMASQERFDVCLVGIPTVPNFGGALTYFALYNTLEDLGYSTLLIERPQNARAKPQKDYSDIYNESPYPEYAVAPLFPTKNAMRQLNGRADVFIVGSDQLFNHHLYKQMGEWITLDWVSDSKQKIAYAASFGHDHIWGDDNTRAEMSFFMKKFDHFSVREASAVRLCAEQFGVEARHVLDPVFLCDRKHYQRIGGAKPDGRAAYISAYLLDMNDEKESILNFCCEKLHMPSEIYSEMYIDSKKYDKRKNSINSRLNSIMHSDFVVTDSFHGTCFAIIFHKNFITIKNRRRGAARFESILGKLGLTHRMVESLDEVRKNRELLADVDWEAVDTRLEREKLASLAWLHNAISSRHAKSFSDYDILLKKIDSIEGRLAGMARKNRILQKRNAALIRALGFGNMTTEENLVAYLKLLKDCNDCVFMAVRDTPGYEANEEIDGLLADLGFTEGLSNKHWHSFVGILCKKKVMFEKMSFKFEDVSFSGIYDEHFIEIVSSSLKKRNLASICIDGNDYSMNSRGLNIVVWNSERDIVIDSVCFDTHTKDIPCIRE